MASWYGEATTEPDGRTCWLKELELVCQYPADLEQHDDNRYLLLARPLDQCEPLCRVLLAENYRCRHTSSWGFDLHCTIIT
jgi:hypothetical protein